MNFGSARPCEYPRARTGRKIQSGTRRTLRTSVSRLRPYGTEHRIVTGLAGLSLERLAPGVLRDCPAPFMDCKNSGLESNSAELDVCFAPKADIVSSSRERAARTC